MIKIKRKLIILSTTFIILVMIGIVSTYAYFQLEEDHGIIISTGDFDVEMFVYFNGQLVNIDSDFYDQDKGVVIVNAYDDTSDNYIEDLDIYIGIIPIVPARYRFKIKQEWELQRYYLNQTAGDEIDPVFQAIYFDDLGGDYYPFSRLTFADGFDALYDKEGYIYPETIVSNTVSGSLYHIIDGGDPYGTRSNAAIDEKCYLYLDLTLEIVQANRFSEVWEIDPTFYD